MPGLSTMVLDPSGPGLVAASYCGPAVSLPMPFHRKRQEVVDPRAGAVERNDRNSLYAGDAGSPSQHAGAGPRSSSRGWRRRGLVDLATSGLRIGGMPTKRCGASLPTHVRAPIRDSCHSQIRVWGSRSREASPDDNYRRKRYKIMVTNRMDIDTGVAGRRADSNGQRRTFTETKAGSKTTEFMLTIAAIVAILIAVYVGDADLDATDGWRYASWVAAAYIVSRGLAKLGTREPYAERFDTD